MSTQASTLSDEDLVLKLAEGDAGALRTLMERYRGPLYGYLRRLLASQDDAEDLFQETFLRVLRHAKRFDRGRRFRPWLYAIASNLVKNTYRWRSYRQGTLALDQELDGDGPSLASSLAGNAPAPSAASESDERAEAVRAAVEALPPKGRVALVLFYYQGLSYEEVAASLEIPLGTVKSRIHNAMKRLGKSLESQEELL